MFFEWLRFDRRIIQFIKLWDIPNIARIYGWWMIVIWPIEWFLGISHLLGLSYLAQWLFWRKGRRLSQREEMLVKDMFGDRISYKLIRLNEKSPIALKMRVAFVTGYAINYYRQMPDSLLIHEITHAYQFQEVGLVYIPRCLFAQTTRVGYDFGEISDHEDILWGRSSLKKLNYEQQAHFMESLHKHGLLADGELDVVFPSFNFQV